MKFIGTEILKNLKVRHWQLLLVLSVVVSFLKAYAFTSSSYTPSLIEKIDPNFKNAYFVFYRTYFSLLNIGFPFIVGLLCFSSIIFIEERQNMFLYHATRRYYLKYNFAKIISIYLFVAVFIALAFLSSAIWLDMLANKLPNVYTAEKPANFVLEGLWFLKFYICALGIISLNYVIVLFWPFKKSKFIASLFLPYLLFVFIPKKTNPFSYLVNDTNQAFQIRSSAVLETDYNLKGIHFITQYETLSLVCVALSLFLIKYFANRYKFSG